MSENKSRFPKIGKLLTYGWVIFGLIACMTTTSITFNIAPDLFALVYLGAYFFSVLWIIVTLGYTVYKKLNIRFE